MFLEMSRCWNVVEIDVEIFMSSKCRDEYAENISRLFPELQKICIKIYPDLLQKIYQEIYRDLSQKIYRDLLQKIYQEIYRDLFQKIYLDLFKYLFWFKYFEIYSSDKVAARIGSDLFSSDRKWIQGPFNSLFSSFNNIIFYVSYYLLLYLFSIFNEQPGIMYLYTLNL